ncbi:MAG TPA: class I SAM-dependent methyltransferase [archaeon]|nr:class I SAM-dependent methyltransferase [archaeon]
MPRQIKRVAGLGEGPILKKAVDLALRHPDVNFFANDLRVHNKSALGEYLHGQGHFEIPPNLKIATGLEAQHILRAEKPNSFDHIYAHFLLQHVPRPQRVELYQQILRTLRPGATFKTVEEEGYGKLISIELAQHGFGVTTKAMASAEVKRLGTPQAEKNAKTLDEFMHRRDELKQSDGSQASESFRRELFDYLKEVKLKERAEQNLETHDGLLLLNRYEQFDTKNQPFVLITARKSKVRYL